MCGRGCTLPHTPQNHWSFLLPDRCTADICVSPKLAPPNPPRKKCAKIVAIMVGRPPKPRMLRILQGRPGHRKLNPAEPTPEAIISPAPPEHLSKIAKELWVEVAEQLCRAHLLTKLDVPLLEVYCEEYSRYRKADEFIRENGAEFKIVNAKGQVQVVRENPAVAIRRSCMATMGKIAAELGLAPSSRSRLAIPPEFLYRRAPKFQNKLTPPAPRGVRFFPSNKRDGPDG